MATCSGPAAPIKTRFGMVGDKGVVTSPVIVNHYLLFDYYLTIIWPLFDTFWFIISSIIQSLQVFHKTKLHGWAQNEISRFWPTTPTTSTGSTLVNRYGRVERNWCDFNFSDSGKMRWLILQMWFFCVRSPCITEAMPWSHTSRRA